MTRLSERLSSLALGDNLVQLKLGLHGSGGDGGSIPGRWDLVDIKRSIMSGNDKGRYKSFNHNSMGWGKDVDEDDSEIKIAMAENCALTQVPLQDPVVACSWGFLYNKAAVFTALINKDFEEQFKHLRSMKDLFDAQLTRNPEFDDKPKSDMQLEAQRSVHFICPVTQLPMNGKYKFVLIRPSKVVLSERGLKETKCKDADGNNICPITSTPFVDEDVIILQRHIHDVEKFHEEHQECIRQIEAEAAEKKKKKKKKKHDDEPVDGGSKRKKVDPSKTISEKKKSEVYNSIFSKDKVDKRSAEDLLMMAPGGLNGTLGVL